MFSRKTPKIKHLVSAARYQIAVDEQGEAWARHHLTVAIDQKEIQEGAKA
jgi:hypothetical protein